MGRPIVVDKRMTGKRGEVYAADNVSQLADIVNSLDDKVTELLKRVKTLEDTVVFGHGVSGDGVIWIDAVTIGEGDAITEGLGIDITDGVVSIENAENLTDDTLPKWDDANGHLVDSIVKGDGNTASVGGALWIETIDSQTSSSSFLCDVSGTVKSAYKLNRKITIINAYPYTVLATDDVVVCE